MPFLKYLADTNVISDWMRGAESVTEWLSAHSGEVAISTLTLAQLRRGIELKAAGKARRELERKFQWVLDDYQTCLWLFDEAAAFEWGRLMAEARNRPIPFDDSLIGAIARSMAARIVTRNVKHFPGCPTVDPWTGTEWPAWRVGR
jgi:predicted nucleic acid-binding protein